MMNVLENLFTFDDIRPLKKKIHSIPEVNVANSNTILDGDIHNYDFEDYINNRLNLDAYITYMDKMNENDENCDFNEEILSEKVIKQKKNTLNEMKYYEQYGQQRLQKLRNFNNTSKETDFLND